MAIANNIKGSHLGLIAADPQPDALVEEIFQISSRLERYLLIGEIKELAIASEEAVEAAAKPTLSPSENYDNFVSRSLPYVVNNPSALSAAIDYYVPSTTTTTYPSVVNKDTSVAAHPSAPSAATDNDVPSSTSTRAWLLNPQHSVLPSPTTSQGQQPHERGCSTTSTPWPGVPSPSPTTSLSTTTSPLAVPRMSLSNLCWTLGGLGTNNLG